MKRFLRPAFYIFVTTGLASACSGRSDPAPVTLLNSQPEPVEEGYNSPTYTVKAGDTLFAIAWYTGNDYRDLANYNNLRAPYSIYPGQVLKVIPPKVTATSAPPPRPATLPAKPKAPPTGPTSSSDHTNRVDPPNKQAYGESENNVNNQPVKAGKNAPELASRPTPEKFADRVDVWVWPANGKVVDTFSSAESGNKGIDIAASRGAAVRAAADGKVVYSGNALRGYGNLVIIKHTDTFLSAYAHNDTIVVKEQQWVVAGQQIATLGDSGTDTVKLHFEVRYRGKSLDPLRYLPKQ
nr:peptidoglycan DD-metalloendopeptidase family protein [Alteromonas aestuariivivens]